MMITLKLIVALLHASIALDFEQNEQWDADDYLINVPLPHHAQDVLFSPVFVPPPANQQAVRKKKQNLEVIEDFDNALSKSKTMHREPEGGYEHENYRPGSPNPDNSNWFRDGSDRAESPKQPSINNAAWGLSTDESVQSGVPFVRVHQSLNGNLNQVMSDYHKVEPYGELSTVADGENFVDLHGSIAVTLTAPLNQAVTRLSGNLDNLYWGQITRSKISVESFYVSNVHTTVFIEPVFYDTRFLARNKASLNPTVNLKSGVIPTSTEAPQLLSTEWSGNQHQPRAEMTTVLYGTPQFSSASKSELGAPPGTKKTPEPLETKLVNELNAEDPVNRRIDRSDNIQAGSEKSTNELEKQAEMPESVVTEAQNEHVRVRPGGKPALTMDVEPITKRPMNDKDEVPSRGTGNTDEVDQIKLSLSSDDVRGTSYVPSISIKDFSGSPAEGVKEPKLLLKKTVEMPLVVVIERLKELYVNLAQTLKYYVGKPDFKFTDASAQAEHCWQAIAGDGFLERPYKFRTDLQDTLGQYLLASSVSSCYGSVVGMIKSRPEEEKHKILPRLAESSALVALAKQLQIHFAHLVFEEQKLHRFTPHQMDIDRRVKAGLPPTNAARGRDVYDLAMHALYLRDYVSSLVWLSYAGEFNDDINFQKSVDQAIMQHDHALANGDDHNTLTVPCGSGQATAHHQRPHTMTDRCLGRLQPTDGLDRHRVCWYSRVLPYFYIPPLKVELVNYRPLLVIYHDVVPHRDSAANARLALKKEKDRRLDAPVYRNLRTDYNFFGHVRNENPVLSPALAARLSTISRGMINKENLQFEMLLPGFRRSVPVHTFVKKEVDQEAARGPTPAPQDAMDSSWTVFLSSSTGGGTVFGKLNTTVFPPKGSVLQIQVKYANGSAADEAHHSTCPVIEGHQDVLHLKHGSWNEEYVHPTQLRDAVEKTQQNFQRTETITPTTTTISTGVTAAGGFRTEIPYTETIVPSVFWNSASHLSASSETSQEASKYHRNSEESDSLMNSATSIQKPEFRTQVPKGLKKIRIIAKSTAYVSELNDTTTKTSTTYTKNGPSMLANTVATVNVLSKDSGRPDTEANTPSNPVELREPNKPFLVTFYETRTAFWTPSRTFDEVPVTATGDRLEVVRDYVGGAHPDAHSQGVAAEQHSDGSKLAKLTTATLAPSYRSESEVEHNASPASPSLLDGENGVKDGVMKNQISEKNNQICFELPRDVSSFSETFLSWACEVREKLKNEEILFKN